MKPTSLTRQPIISIIVINLNGRTLLAECFDSLFAQNYTQSKIEIILVDNGSIDQSIQFVKENYPDVRVVEAGRNLGFAGGNNAGAEIATGEYLALINNDAVAHPQWLASMVEVAVQQPEYVCIASKILNQTGQTIDFVGSALNLYGRSFQLDEGTGVGSSFYEDQREILAPCGGAMLIRKDVFVEIGGFDEDYIAYFEDVDLGWRLWLLGYKVLFVPQAVVYHKQHQTGVGFPTEQRYVLSEANALRTVIKNFGQENFWQILSFNLFMGVKKSLEQAQLNRLQYQFGYKPLNSLHSGDSPEPQMTKIATSFLVAIEQVTDELPHWLTKRARIQGNRKRSDEEIFSKFPIWTDNPLFPWRSFHIMQEQLTDSLNISKMLKPKHGSHLLIITHETIGPKMAGPGIRAWEMACALSTEFKVTLAAAGKPQRIFPGLRVVGYDPKDSNYTELIAYISGVDVVMAMGALFMQMPVLQTLTKPTIVDLYDPFEIEKLAQSPKIDKIHHLNMDLDSLINLSLQGGIGDFFICANERQRDFWLGTLLASGRLNTVTYAQDTTLRKLIDIVPFGISDTPPVKKHPVLKGVVSGINPDDKVLLWNGGLWEWFDPLLLIEALIKVLVVRNDVKLYFAAGRHFNLDTVPEMPVYTKTINRCKELDLLDKHVFFGDWIPYDDRGDYLLEADLAVSIHKPNIESHFASRTRLLDCIWADLPVITTTGDPVSQLIAASGLGKTVLSGQVDMLAETIVDMLAEPVLSQSVAQKSAPIKSELGWAQVVKPIANFVQQASFAPDAFKAAKVAAEVRQLHEIRIENDRLQAHLNQIEQGRVMKFMNTVNKMLGRS